MFYTGDPQLNFRNIYSKNEGALIITRKFKLKKNT